MIKLSLENKDQTPSASRKPWIGVDLDGTVAEYTRWMNWNVIGKPIPKMVERIKGWIKEGIEVKILTARAGKVSCMMNKITPDQQIAVIKAWTKEHIGQELDVVTEKDPNMLFAVDDAIVQIKKNTGDPLAKDGFDVIYKERMKNFLKNKKKDE